MATVERGAGTQKGTLRRSTDSVSIQKDCDLGNLALCRALRLLLQSVAAGFDGVEANDNNFGAGAALVCRARQTHYSLHAGMIDGTGIKFYAKQEYQPHLFAAHTPTKSGGIVTP